MSLWSRYQSITSDACDLKRLDNQRRKIWLCLLTTQERPVWGCLEVIGWICCTCEMFTTKFWKCFSTDDFDHTSVCSSGWGCLQTIGWICCTYEMFTTKFWKCFSTDDFDHTSVCSSGWGCLQTIGWICCTCEMFVTKFSSAFRQLTWMFGLSIICSCYHSPFLKSCIYNQHEEQILQ